MNLNDDTLTIGGKPFKSRLFVGTGKYASMEDMAASIEASGTDMVTVAIRRVDLNDPEKNLLNYLDFSAYHFLPNTAGAKTAEEAIRIAHLGRAASEQNFVKLEVIPDPKYLLPDGPETLKAATELIKDGFIVLPYIQADPILARQLEDVGAATVMPLGSPIGSNRGILTRANIEIIIEQATIPVVVDAGLGQASHAAEAMEMGADAVLVNTAIAKAQDPVSMARAFKHAVIAGRLGYLSVPSAPQTEASASSPLTGVVGKD
jgi:thiazole synthase